MQGDLRKRLLIAAVVVLGCGLASAQNQALERTYIDQGYYKSGLAIPPGSERTVVGPEVTITCPGTTTCTVQADQFIQEGDGSTTGNESLIGFYIDSLEAAEQQVGETPADDSYQVFSTSELVEVAAGTHTVQIYVYSNHGMSVYNYATTFRVYKP
jgi:hypothetical protein